LAFPIPCRRGCARAVWPLRTRNKLLSSSSTATDPAELRKLSNDRRYRFVAHATDYGDHIVCLEDNTSPQGVGPLFYTWSWFCPSAIFASLEAFHTHIFNECPVGHFLKAWRCVRWLRFRPKEFLSHNTVRWSRSGCRGLWSAQRQAFSCLCLSDIEQFVHAPDRLPGGHVCVRPQDEPILSFPFYRSAGFYRPVELPPYFDQYWRVSSAARLPEGNREVCRVGSVRITKTEYWRCLKSFREQVADCSYPCAKCGLLVRTKEAGLLEVSQSFVSPLRTKAPGALHLNRRLSSDGRAIPCTNTNGEETFKVKSF
jgi:hypothetical protein